MLCNNTVFLHQKHRAHSGDAFDWLQKDLVLYIARGYNILRLKYIFITCS